MTLELRNRKFRFMALQGHGWTDSGGVISSETFPYREIAEHQFTWSEGHPWPKGSGVQNIGGPFETIRTRYQSSYDLSSTFSVGGGAAIKRRYVGNCLPVYPEIAALSAQAQETDLKYFVPSLGDSTLGSMGSSAISSCAPTAPVVDGSVALAELFREGIPSLIGLQLLKSRTRTAQAAGGEYLNIQFGWLPLLSDLRKTAQAVIQTEAIVKQLLRDSGKNVRRRYDFPPSVDMVSSDFGLSAFPWPHLTTNHWTNSGIAPMIHTKTERSVWFEGCFTYYLDPSSLTGLEGAASQARLLFGLNLTPDVLWNLAPWSWLVDWVINVGPVIRNISLFAQDGLTLRYGYTMEHTKVTRTHRWPNLRSSWGAPPPNPTFILQGERKRRLEQAPFVLGLTGAEFTSRRAAILTALGLTRMR